MILQFTDGTTTLTVSSDEMYVTEFKLMVPTDLSSPIQEKANVRFISSTGDVQDNINTLNKLFFQAALYARNRIGKRVYVEFNPADTGDNYRSLLYSGAVAPLDKALGYEWRNANVECEVSWIRQPFWEGPLTDVPLTNSHASSEVAGIEVNNAHDPTNSLENIVNIDAAGIDGDLPAALKIEMLNATGSADPSDEIYVFHNVYSSPFDLAHVIEAEAATGETVTDHSDANCSGLYYATLAWTATTETLIASMNISSDQAEFAAGGRFAILARWRGLFPYADCWLRARLQVAVDARDVFVGDLSLVSPIVSGRELTLLETMRIPPYLDGQTDVSALILALYGKRNNASNSIDLDYIQLCPISGDAGWLRFKSVSAGVAYGETFLHDAIESYTYKIDGSGNKSAEFAQYGGPLLLIPGVDQRLYFNTCDKNGYAKIGQQWTVKVSYRPRRVSL